MNTIFKNILAILGGGLIGMMVNMGLIITGNQLIPFEDGINPMNATMWDIKYFIFPFLAHAIGTLSGAFIASKISKHYNRAVAIAVGVYFLSGGIYMVKILPAPTWFICLDLILCYLPMALLGWYLNRK